MKLHIEVERFEERVFVRFFFRSISAGVLMFHPHEWDRFEGALMRVFEVTSDTVLDYTAK